MSERSSQSRQANLASRPKTAGAMTSGKSRRDRRTQPQGMGAEKRRFVRNADARGAD